MFEEKHATSESEVGFGRQSGWMRAVLPEFGEFDRVAFRGGLSQGPEKGVNRPLQFPLSATSPFQYLKIDDELPARIALVDACHEV